MLREDSDLFEMNVVVPTNRLLTDKRHQDGSPLSRSRSDGAKMSSSGYLIEDKVIFSDFRNSSSNRKSNGTSVKMFVAHEMSKEVDSRRSPPNVVAKLMGLETLPRHETDSYTQRSHHRSHPRNPSNIQVNCGEQQIEFFRHIEPNECKVVYEILEKAPHKVRFGGTTDDKRMALVRQKFTEAKHLSMDEELRQSKQFQDALEVLNANKDLFLKCLQEPNSILSQNLFNLQSSPRPPPETKRITILKPSKIADGDNFSRSWNNDGKEIKKGSFMLNGLDKSKLINSPPASWNNFENSPQPTRIVVLKPSSLKSCDAKAVGSPHSESRRVINGEDEFGDVEDDENQTSKEVAKAISQQMLEKIGRYHMNETLTSSMISNGYVGDGSSLDKSEMEYTTANLSDSEVMSPVSRHSWDYVNRNGSPYSSSSFSRVSYSPESSVCREAKKRLSERWAMMESNETCLEQRYVRRSSSTLGEMLALSEKKAPMLGEVGNSNKEPVDSNSFIGSDLRTNENMNNSPKNLMRSKSVPVSSSEYGTRLNTDVSFPDNVQSETPKEDTKERSVKSSFKLKMASLFFSRNKRSRKDEYLLSEIKDELHSSRIDPGKIGGHRTAGLNDQGSELFSRNLPERSSIASFSNQVGKSGTLLPETVFSTTNPTTCGNPSENLDQPSPISVLDRPFEEDNHSAMMFPHYVKPDQQGVKLPVNPIRSNLIDKSPPIGSIARTLSWDDSCVDTASSYSPNQSLMSQGTEDEEREWFSFVKTLLSAAGMQGEMQFNTLPTKWHSPDSPLDPSLRDKYIDLKGQEILYEAKRRQKRSTRKLVFDCVNATLVEIAGYGSVSGQSSIPSMKAGYNLLENASYTVLDEVWTRMNALFFPCEVKCVSDDCEDENDLVLERLVGKEVVGKGWIDNLRLEIDNFGHEIEVKMLEELVQEAVAELTGSV